MHTQEGMKMLHNFVRDICGCKGDWKMDSFVEASIKAIREKVGSGKVALRIERRRRLLSGGGAVSKKQSEGSSHVCLCGPWFA